MGIIGTRLQTPNFTDLPIYRDGDPDPLIQQFIDVLYEEVFDLHPDDAEVDLIVVHDAETLVALDYRVFRVHNVEDEDVSSGSDYEDREAFLRAMFDWGYSGGEDTLFVWFHKHPEGFATPGLKDYTGTLAMRALDYVYGIPNENGDMKKRYRFMVVTNRDVHPAFDPSGDALPFTDIPALNREVREKRHAITADLLGVESEMWQVEEELFELIDQVEQGGNVDPEQIRTLAERYNAINDEMYREANPEAHAERRQREQQELAQAKQALERLLGELASNLGAEVEVVLPEPPKPIRRTFGPPEPTATPVPERFSLAVPDEDDLTPFDPTLLDGINFGDLSFLD